MMLQLDHEVAVRSLDDQVYEVLREAILDCRIQPGTPLVERELATHFRISKTPIREALLRLELEGFVVKFPHKGTFVTEVSLRDMRDIFQIRSVLEGLAVRLAVPLFSHDDLEEGHDILAETDNALAHGDLELCPIKGREFHELFLRKVTNQWLIDYIRLLNCHVERGRKQMERLPIGSRKSFEEHKIVLKAVEEGGPIAAEQAMREHIESVIVELEAGMGKGGDDPGKQF